MRQMNFGRLAVGQTRTLIVVALGVVCLWAVARAQKVASGAPDAVVVDAPDAVAAVQRCGVDEATATDAAPPPRPCKPCKDRPWCECTYNGAPRISCDPCCYDTYPYPTCLD